MSDQLRQLAQAVVDAYRWHHPNDPRSVEAMKTAADALREYLAANPPPESARDVLARLGFPATTEAEEEANLQHNMGNRYCYVCRKTVSVDPPPDELALLRELEHRMRYPGRILSPADHLALDRLDALRAKGGK